MPLDLELTVLSESALSEAAAIQARAFFDDPLFEFVFPVERDLQELLAAAPQHCGEGFRLVRREWPTDIGPVDLMCRDHAEG